MTADWIVSRSGAKLDAVGLTAAHAAGQVTAISSNVPESLATVALEHVVGR